MRRSYGAFCLVGEFRLRIISRLLENYTHAAHRLHAVHWSKAKAQTAMSFPPETCWVGPFLNSPLSLKYICALSRAHRPALLEALPTKYRPPLCGTERNCGFLPALRAVCLRFRAHR